MSAISEVSDMERICAFCGSNDTGESAYTAALPAFAEECVDRDIGLVYGGGRGGTMGGLADAVLAGGGEVIGVLPESLREREEPHEGLTELVVTETKAERKDRMVELADGFVAFPGGIGTHEELFDVLGRAKHGFHHKPCGLLNVAGYYDNLVAHFDHGAEERFLSEAQRDLALVESDPAALLNAFESYESPFAGD
jgi:uncharacterized protein (TIGR00730 family)